MHTCLGNGTTMAMSEILHHIPVSNFGARISLQGFVPGRIPVRDDFGKILPEISMCLRCSELGKALQKCSLQGFVPGRIPVRTFEGQKFLTGISTCRCCFCCSMHTSLGKCGIATTGKLLDHCTQLSNCKNPLVVAMSQSFSPSPVHPWWPCPTFTVQCQYACGGPATQSQSSSH